MRNDFQDLFTNGIEGIVFEVTIKQKKWLISTIYKPPNIQDEIFTRCLTNITESMLSETSLIMHIGDMNFNMKHDNALTECSDILGLTNLITSDTCFKGTVPTLLDVILTTSRFSFVNDYVNTDTGLSDCHNLIGCALKAFAPKRTSKMICYRSYKKFDENVFLNDLRNVDFNICLSLPNVNDQMGIYNALFSDVLNKHAPLKKKIIKKNPPPFMNSELRKAVFKKCMLRNKFYKTRTQSNWKLYKNQRNKVTRLRRMSIRNYFKEKTYGVRNSKEFWKIIKPFISDKNGAADENIILRENGKLITNPMDVCNTFNTFFTSVADSIGFPDTIPHDISGKELIKSIYEKYSKHPSIIAINSHRTSNDFSFTHTNEIEVRKTILKLDINKSMGHDFISAKILKLSVNEICPIITTLINQCIDNDMFPCELKLAEVSSIFKKKDKLDKENYRPISLLIIMSKVFEKLFVKRLNVYFHDHFSPYLSAYREGYNCEHVLTKFICAWKAALDKNEYFGAVLMDLSKAFDCLPHCLLIAKCFAYGLSYHACLLICSYLSNRKQRVKLGSSRSDWLFLKKGVPQGSIMGPVLFNIFINDIFYFVTSSTLLNYADDNTLVYNHNDQDVLISMLSHDSNIAVKWFHDNGMQANPGKFQAIISHRCARDFKPISVGNVIVNPDKSVKLLGVTFDVKLSFDEHVSNICKKASCQLNVLKRFSNTLSTENKLRIYHSFILSNFIYCPIVWHFCSKSKSSMIERIQERALRFVFNDHSAPYCNLLSRINRNTMHSMRLKCIVIFVYKSLNGACPSYLHSMFERKMCTYNMRDCLTVVQPKMNTVTHGINSIIYHGAKMWNSLPVNIKSAESVQKFKLMLKSYNEVMCTCFNCTMH
jgi:hypothetical protein